MALRKKNRTLFTAFLPGGKVTYFIGSGCFTGSGRSEESWRVQVTCRTCGSPWWAGYMLRYSAVCFCVMPHCVHPFIFELGLALSVIQRSLLGYT